MAAEEAREVLSRFEQELQGAGLSLENTVRTRLWGRDRESRTLGSGERTRILSGPARAASSSYISPGHFDSKAHVALDLLALRPPRAPVEKRLKEYDPAVVPPQYLVYDSVVFLSGVTGDAADFASQVMGALSAISSSLADAGTSWSQAVKVSFFLHRSQKLKTLQELFVKTVRAEVPCETSFVDGFASAGRLIEIEVTATL